MNDRQPTTWPISRSWRIAIFGAILSAGFGCVLLTALVCHQVNRHHEQEKVVLQQRADAAAIRAVGQNPIAAESFLWTYDTTGGIAIIYVVKNPKYQLGVEQLAQPEGDVRIEATSTGRLSQHWEIDEAAAYFRDEGKARRCLTEGPFPWEVRDTGPNERTYVWTMHRLTRSRYEFALLLHKKKDGMFLDAVEQAVCRGELIVKSEPIVLCDVRPSEETDE